MKGGTSPQTKHLDTVFQFGALHQIIREVSLHFVHFLCLQMGKYRFRSGSLPVPSTELVPVLKGALRCY